MRNLASVGDGESESEGAGIGGGGGFLDFLRGWSSTPSSELLLLLLLLSSSFRPLLSFSFFLFSSSSFSLSLNRRSSSASSFFLRSSSSRRLCSSRFFQSLIWSDPLSLQKATNKQTNQPSQSTSLSFTCVLPQLIMAKHCWNILAQMDTPVTRCCDILDIWLPKCV